MLAPQLHHLYLALLATLLLAASSAIAQSSSTLSVVDIILDAPTDAATCQPTTITWSWDGTGSIPTDDVALSVINASDFASSRRRRSPPPGHHVDTAHLFALDKRVTLRGQEIDGAGSISFDFSEYDWTKVDVAAGRYRLLLTILASGSSVVSDPFTVVSSGDTSCIAAAAASSTSASVGSSASSSGSSPISTSTAAAGLSSSAHTTGAATANSAASSAAGSAASSASTSSAGDGSHENNSGSSGGGGGSSHGGSIAAGILVPLAAIIAVAIFWYRKRKADATGARSKRNSPGGSGGWSEKFFGGIGGGATAAGGANNRQSGHRREISGPQMASVSALAAVANMVPAELRTEKDEAAIRAAPASPAAAAAAPAPPTPALLASPRSPTSDNGGRDGEHWIDFGDDDRNGARPLSPSTIDSRHLGAYNSEASRSPNLDQGTPNMGSIGNAGNALYAQGRNIPLHQMSRGSSIAHDSISTFGTPAEAGNGAQRGSGRDLLAGTPIRSASLASSTSAATSSPFGDDNAVEVATATRTNLQRSASTATTTTRAGAVNLARSASTATNATTTLAAPGSTSLQRSDSTGSQFGVKRKAVPRYSAASPQKQQPQQNDADEALSPEEAYVDGFEDAYPEMDPSTDPFRDGSAVDAAASKRQSEPQLDSPTLPISPMPPMPETPKGRDAGDDEDDVRNTRPTSLPETPASAVQTRDNANDDAASEFQEVLRSAHPSVRNSVASKGDVASTSAKEGSDADAAKRDDYHLSLHMPADSGFRVSF